MSITYLNAVKKLYELGVDGLPAPSFSEYLKLDPVESFKWAVKNKLIFLNISKDILQELAWELRDDLDLEKESIKAIIISRYKSETRRLKELPKYKFKDKVRTSTSWFYWCKYFKTPEDELEILLTGQYLRLSGNAKREFENTLHPVTIARYLITMSRQPGLVQNVFYSTILTLMENYNISVLFRDVQELLLPYKDDMINLIRVMRDKQPSWRYTSKYIADYLCNYGDFNSYLRVLPFRDVTDIMPFISYRGYGVEVDYLEYPKPSNVAYFSQLRNTKIPKEALKTLDELHEECIVFGKHMSPWLKGTKGSEAPRVTKRRKLFQRWI